MATQNICSSSSSSSSSSTPKWNYDVFVSFRGEDTRKNFTDHLYAALERKGIRAFKDDEKLERGKEISQGLRKAIEESRISIIVLSCSYASSTWCLDELVKILDCRAANGQTVVPIFYDVDPSEVRKQTAGSFAQAFAKYEKDFKKIEQVKRWRTALTEVANLSGWDLRNTDGHEAKFIQNFVQDIWSRLNQNHTSLYVAKHPVGIHYRVKKINSLLGVGGLDDVRIIGILGIGGIGKTTLAKAIYNEVAKHFEGSTFLANVREDSRKHGLVHLQQKLLSEILKEENLKISSVDRGVNVIKERLCSRRVLVILDDVDDLEQLEKLAGKPNWFGLGSRVIITTRDEHMLTTYEVYKTCMVETLEYNEALQLFCLNAFKEDHPLTNDFLEVSDHVVNYAGGLPLALKVLGSFLCKKSIDEWKSALDQLQKIPKEEIHEILKISYEGLGRNEKDIFLHVACFFNGENKDYVMEVLESCGYHADIGVRVLIQRSLITISDYNGLQMHDLLQQMGQEIVLQESPDEPGKRSRLWFDEDVYHVLTKNTGTEAIKGIVVNSSMAKEINFSNEAFTGMHNLRLLEVSNVHPSKKFNYLPDKLRCLIWNGYPLKSMPSKFRPEKYLVKLDLRYSRMKQLWETKINLENLKFFDVSHSQYLIKSPDFSGMPKLETLILVGCTRLVEVHPSSLVLDRLVFLNLADCKSLRRLWKSIKFESLEIVTLSRCSKLQNFPYIQGTMERLSKVYLDGTGIKDLPSSIEHLTGLVLLDLENCKSLTSLPRGICELKSLETLKLLGCSKLAELPEDLGNMENLVGLYLCGTAIRKLPSSIVLLKNLRVLSFRGCKGSSSNMWYSNFSSWIFSRKVPCSSSLLLPSLSGLCSLRTLDLSDCNLSEGAIPIDIVSLSSLVDLNLSKNNFVSLLLPSLSGLCSLRRLDLSDCNLSEGAILSDIVSLSSLVRLNLSKNNFVSLPATLDQLNSLTVLRLVHCTRLQALPPLPTSICEIDAHGCKSLEKLAYPPQNLEWRHRKFGFGDCKILAGHKGSIFFQRQCQAIHGDQKFSLFAPGSEIPEWFNKQSMGSLISWKMSPLEYSKVKGVACCAVLPFEDLDFGAYISSGRDLECDDGSIRFCCGVYDVTSGGLDEMAFLYGTVPCRNLVSNHVWLSYEPLVNHFNRTTSDEWCHFEASFYFFQSAEGDLLPVKKCGVHIIYNEDDEPTMIEDYSPNLGTFHPNFEDVNHKRRLDEEEASGSLCARPKRMRANTNTL